MITLGQLLEPTTEEQALDYALGQLASLGFQATSWQEGSIQYTIVRVLSRLYSDLTIAVSDKAAGNYARFARGKYQDELGEHTFDIERIGAVETEGEMVLTSSATAPIHTWVAGELVIADQPQEPANTWRVNDAGTLNPGEELTFDVTAEVAGTDANIAPNTPLYLWTPLVGVEVTNPPRDLSSTWITTQGQDAEESTRYADRMLGRWNRTSLGTEEAYAAWALEAVPELTRVLVIEGDVSGEVRIIGATASGGLTGDQITAIEEYLLGVTDGRVRRLINDTLIVESATVVTTPALSLVVTCDSSQAFDCSSRSSQALLTMLAAIPIGGEIISPLTIGQIYSSRIYGAIMPLTGVRNVSGVPADFPLQPTDIYQPAITITVVSN